MVDTTRWAKGLAGSAALSVGAAALALTAPSLPAAAASPATAGTLTATLGGPGHAEMYPSGVEVAPGGSVVVADTGNDQIAEYSASGTQLWRVGAPGSGKLQFQQPRDAGVDDSGNVYVADNGNGRIVVLSSGGAWVTSFKGPANDSIGAPIGVSVRSGLVYVADANHNRVHVFTTAGSQVRSFGSQGACVINRFRDVAADASGNVYIANYTSNNVLEMSSTGTCIRTWGTKGSATGQFKNPYGVTVGTDPVLGGPAVYVADSNNERIQEFTPTGTFVASAGSAGTTTSTFYQLRRVAVATDGSGDVWGADLWGNKVLQFHRTSTGFTAGQLLGGTPAPLSPGHVFNQVRGLAFDGNGNLAAMDTVNQRVVTMTTSGGNLSACGQRGFTKGGFNWPRGVAIDRSTGNIWVADTKQSDIQILKPDCTVLARFSTVGKALNQLDWPFSIAIRQSDGTAWVADTYNNRIVSYSVSTHAPIAAFGTLGSGSGQFNQPSGIAVNPANGHILVADSKNNRVVELADSNGSSINVVRTLTDGLKQPRGVGADAAGHIAVADTMNNRVVLLNADGSQAALLAGGYDRPENLAFDPSNALYVADTYNDRILVYSLTWSSAIIQGGSATAVGTIGSPGSGHAGLYGWGATTMTDGSVLIGDYWNYRIAHYNANGTPATPATFVGKKGFGPGTNQAPYGLGVDPVNGDVYMAEGSLPDVNRYDRNGNFITSYGTNKAVVPMSFKYPARVAVSPTEQVYVVDQWGNDIKVLTPSGTLLRTVGTGQLIQPRGIAFDTSGRYWVGDQGHHRIIIYNADDTIDRTLPPPGGSGATFQLRGLAIDQANKVAYVANGSGCRVQKFNADPSSPSYGAYLLQFGSCGTGNGQFEDGAREVTVAGDGNVWVGDLGNFRAQVFSPSGAFLFAVPSPAAPPPTGGFNGPRGVTFDSAGNMYVTDTYNERMEKFSPSGTFLQAWGMRGTTASGFNYPRLVCFNPVTNQVVMANTDSSQIAAYSTGGVFQWATGGFADPYGVACGSDGTMYVADSNHHDIAVLSSGGVKTGTIGTNLNFVRGIWVDGDGSIWASDSVGDQVWHFAANGTQLLHFTTGTKTNPFGIAGDAAGIYIAMSGSNKVAQYDRSGNLLQTFGSAGAKLGQLRTPQGLAFGPNGHLYIVEQNNDRVSEWAVP